MAGASGTFISGRSGILSLQISALQLPAGDVDEDLELGSGVGQKMERGKENMSWLDYYELLEKYDGNLNRATKDEMSFAAKCNPNDPSSARAVAESAWLKTRCPNPLPFPHEVSCQCCRDRRRCNYCGKNSTEWRGHGPHVDGWPDRCTNGRCLNCCQKHCTHITS